MNDEKRFTPQEANALLPSVRADLALLQETKRQYSERLAILKRMREELQDRPVQAKEEDPFFELECELEFLQIEARSQIHSFQLKGVQLKDIDTGLVDFPAVLNGEEVLLCWRQDEDRVSHYHGLYDGFSGRKPLEE